jgi:hypothetical protein
VKSETLSDTINVEPNNVDEPEPTAFPEEEVKPLNNRAQKLIDELTAKGISVPYPSDFDKWDVDTFQRIEKLNK